MAIDLSSKESMFRDMRPHIGHDIVCVRYGQDDEVLNVAIECETCGCVLIDASPEGDEHAGN